MSLPKTFRQLEYIQTTGTQYIDTGLTVKNNTYFVLECAPTTINQDNKIFGAYNGSYAGVAVGTLNSKWRLGSHWGNNTVACNLDKTRITGASTTWMIASTTSTEIVTVNEGITAININMYVGCANYENSPMSASCKIWSLSINEDSTRVREYIPVQRKSDNEIGLYDLANDVFYTNDGTGTFIAGPVVDENTSISKVVYGSDTLIDLTLDTVTEVSLESGITAHSADGSMITGTLIKAVPIDIDNDTDMNAVLVAANVGKCYRFTGTTGTYTNGDLYVVEESE